MGVSRNKRFPPLPTNVYFVRDGEVWQDKLHWILTQNKAGNTEPVHLWSARIAGLVLCFFFIMTQADHYTMARVDPGVWNQA